jgi:hypothetical protein
MTNYNFHEDPDNTITGFSPNLSNPQVIAAFMDLARLNLADVVSEGMIAGSLSPRQASVLMGVIRLLTEMRFTAGSGKPWDLEDQSKFGLDLLKRLEELAHAKQTPLGVAADQILDQLRRDGLIG